MSYAENQLNDLFKKSSKILNSIAPFLLFILLAKSIYKKETKNIIFWSGFLLIGYLYSKNETASNIETIAFYAIDALQEWVMLIIEFILDII